MKENKPFDCVEMKLQLQQRLREKWRGLTDEEIVARFHAEVEISDDTLARWWRQVRDHRREGRSNEPATR